MDTFLTLVIALGGIATGIGAIWTAMLGRRQLDEQRQFLKEQNQSLAEQNERVRLNLEVDLLLRLEDRFDSGQMQAIRRRAARYIKDTFFADGSLYGRCTPSTATYGKCSTSTKTWATS